MPRLRDYVTDGFKGTLALSESKGGPLLNMPSRFRGLDGRQVLMFVSDSAGYISNNLIEGHEPHMQMIADWGSTVYNAHTVCVGHATKLLYGCDMNLTYQDGNSSSTVIKNRILAILYSVQHRLNAAFFEVVFVLSHLEYVLYGDAILELQQQGYSIWLSSYQLERGAVPLLSALDAYQDGLPRFADPSERQTSGLAIEREADYALTVLKNLRWIQQHGILATV